MQSKIILIPRNIVVGVGCRRGTEYLKIKSSVMTILEKADVSAENVNCVASINKKADEKGMNRAGRGVTGRFHYIYGR